MSSLLINYLVIQCHYLVSMKLMSSQHFVHVLVKMSRRVARKSIKAFLLFGFRVNDFNFGESNMDIISFFIGYLSTGKCFTKCDAISLFIPLKTWQRSAGRSTLDRAAFCLYGIILFSENRSMYFLMASICDKSPSHHATAVCIDAKVAILLMLLVDTQNKNMFLIMLEALFLGPYIVSNQKQMANLLAGTTPTSPPPIHRPGHFLW
jgi:hypothetical protein